MKYIRRFAWFGRELEIALVIVFVALTVVVVILVAFLVAPGPSKGAEADSTGTATIRAASYLPAPQRDMPTMPLDTASPYPGWTRLYESWPARTFESVSYVKSRTPQYVRTVACTVPGGFATRDVPSGPVPVVLLLFLGGGPCDANRHEIWAVHRGDVADVTNYLGAAMYRPGQVRVLALYPAHAETVNVRRSEP